MPAAGRQVSAPRKGGWHDQQLGKLETRARGLGLGLLLLDCA